MLRAIFCLSLAGCGELAVNGLFPPEEEKKQEERAPAPPPPMPGATKDAGSIEAAATIDTTCRVGFMVAGVPGDPEVILVGDAPILGGWNVLEGVTMRRLHHGSYGAGVRLQEGATVEFKFVQRLPSGAVIWESWGPGNRSLKVSCADAAVEDAGASGACYVGVWNSPPLD
jgi:hypothetical protein